MAGGSVLRGLLLHGALSAWALRYAYGQIRSGAWTIVGNISAAGVYERVFRWKLLAAHGVLLLAGWWLTHWSWIVGAFLVVVLSRIALIVLMALGVFKSPRRRPGPVNIQGTVVYPNAAGDREEADQGVSDDWGRP
jgi:hypothetical protein